MRSKDAHKQLAQTSLRGKLVLKKPSKNFPKTKYTICLEKRLEGETNGQH